MFRTRVRRWLYPAWLGGIRATSPLSSCYGFDRGTPVDRYYIDRFLQNYRKDISGSVLEVKDSSYTDRYGIDVQSRDVLDIAQSNPVATIVADLARGDQIPSNRFDCFLLTQTMQLIYDFRSAVTHAHRLLRSSGVLLVTVPTVSRIVRAHEGTDYWRFTAASCRSLFGEIFGSERVTVHSYGNVLTAMAFLKGMAAEELPDRHLGVHDPAFPLLIGVRAIKR